MCDSHFCSRKRIGLDLIKAWGDGRLPVPPIQRTVQYGMILADNGSAWYISGAPHPNWDNDVLHQLDAVVGSDFEAVDVSSFMVSPNSGQVQGFSFSATPSSQAIDAGESATYQLNLTKIASNFASTVTLTPNSSPPNLQISLSPNSLTPSGLVTLILTDTHPSGLPISPVLHNLTITGVGGGFSQPATISLLVGGAKTYLPVILK